MTLALQTLPLAHRQIDQPSPGVVIGSLDGVAAEAMATIGGYAFQVIDFAERIRDNSRGLCISLWRCKQAYHSAIGLPGGGGVGGHTGWDAFCQTNFASVGLSVNNIRTAVKVGEQLVHTQETDLEAYEALGSLSRAALFALGHAPDQVIVEVKETLKKDPTTSITAQSIQRMKAEHRLAQEQNLELQTANTELSTTIADLNARITAQDNEAIKLKDAIEDLTLKAKTPVESLVETLPNGVKDQAEFLDSLKRESKEKKSELDKIEASILEQRKSLANLKETADVIASFKADVAKLTEKYSHVLVQKTSDQSSSAKTAFTEAAHMLHALADQLTSTR